LDQSALNPALLADSLAAVNAYVRSAQQAADLVEDDAFNATMFMTDTEQKFGAADKAIGELVGAAMTLSGASERDAAETLSRTVWVIPAASAAAALLSMLSSSLLGRVISRPIVAMTGAMRRLANGDLTAEVPAADRTDEV